MVAGPPGISCWCDLVYECDLWIPGHYDRAAWRRYKEAARGERGRSGTDHVEATIRDLMSATRTARNREL